MWILKFGIGFILSGFETIQFIIALSYILKWQSFMDLIKSSLEKLNNNNNVKIIIEQLIKNLPQWVSSESLWGGVLIILGTIIVLLSFITMKIFINRKKNTLKPIKKGFCFTRKYIKLSIWTLFLLFFLIGSVILLSSFAPSAHNSLINGIPFPIPSIIIKISEVAFNMQKYLPYVIAGYAGVNIIFYAWFVVKRVKGSLLMMIFLITFIINGLFNIEQISGINIYSSSSHITTDIWNYGDIIPITSALGSLAGIFFLSYTLFSYKSVVSKMFLGYTNINDIFILKISKINLQKAQIKHNILRNSINKVRGQQLVTANDANFRERILQEQGIDPLTIKKVNMQINNYSINHQPNSYQHNQHQVNQKPVSEQINEHQDHQHLISEKPENQQINHQLENEQANQLNSDQISEVQINSLVPNYINEKIVKDKPAPDKIEDTVTEEYNNEYY